MDCTRARFDRDRLPAPSLGSALLLLVAVWTALPLGALAAPVVGSDGALLLSFGLACLYVVQATPLSRLGWAPRVDLPLLGTASAGGLAILQVGVRLEIAPLLSKGPSPAEVLCVVLLAPVFEEGLYRHHLLRAVAARTGPSFAVALTSTAFAIPHLEPLQVGGTFLVGAALGVLALRTGRLLACMAVHAGLNLGAACGRGLA